MRFFGLTCIASPLIDGNDFLSVNLIIEKNRITGNVAPDCYGVGAGNPKIVGNRTAEFRLIWQVPSVG